MEASARLVVLESKLPMREDALEGLWATIDAELERLEAIRACLWENQDAPALSEKIDRAAFDDSKTGVLRRRYQSANHMDMHRCLKQLTEQRRQSEIYTEEDRINEKKARAARANELYKLPGTTSAHLRNEAKSSDTKDTQISTSGKPAGARPRDFADPAEYVQRVVGTKAEASEGPRLSELAAPAGRAAQKPS
jgi:hypothetical protein